MRRAQHELAQGRAANVQAPILDDDDERHGPELAPLAAVVVFVVVAIAGAR